MVTGQVRRMQKTDPRPVAVRGRTGNARWHPLFDGNPRMSRDGVNAQWLDNWPGHRPYIESFTPDRWTWRAWKCPRGEIFFTEEEKAFGASVGDFVVIEPHIKAAASPNKDWGFDRWQQVVRSRPKLPWAQLGPAGTRWLEGVRRVETSGFRLAAAALRNSLAYVGPEGGLHHAAAAVGIPAVVIFGGYISPSQTGYSEHVNLTAGGAPCGMRKPCSHCRKAMAAISVGIVLAGLDDALSRAAAA